VSTALEEYRSLREELLSHQKANQVTLQFGLAGLAVLVGLGLKMQDSLSHAGTLLLLVPSLTLFMVTAWFRRASTAMRIGSYLASLEIRINDVIDGSLPPLLWEQTVRNQRRHYGYRRTYFSAEFGAALLLTIASILLALSKLLTERIRLSTVIFGVAGFVLLTATVGAYVYGTRRVNRESSDVSRWEGWLPDSRHSLKR
jgi:hypothetical protein